MRYIVLLSVLFLTAFQGLDLEGQYRSRNMRGSWSFVASYNPGVGFSFSDTVSDADENFYYTGLQLGMYKDASKQLVYTFNLDIKHKRSKFPYVAAVGDTITGSNHFGYVDLSAGIEYLPFDFEIGLKPFVGASISPTYNYSYHRVVSDLFVLDYLNGTFLLMTHVEAGLYYEISNYMDIRFSVMGGYNLLPNWKNFVLLQSRLGIRYFF